MITTDIAPFAGTVGGGFFLGLLAGYAIRKVIKIVAVIVCSIIILDVLDSANASEQILA